MYSKSMVLRIFCCLIVFLLSLGTASATVFFSEDWDSGTPPACWPAKNVGTSCCGDAFHGWTGRSWDCTLSGGQGSGLDTTYKHSGTRSLKVIREIGSAYSCEVYKAFTATTKVYFRAYVYFPSECWNNWDYNPGNAGATGEHWVYLNSARSGTGTDINIWDSSTQSPWPPICHTGVNEAYFVGENQGTIFASRTELSGCWNITAHTDQWYCLEFMFDIPNQEYAFWIDGVQMVGTGGHGVRQTLSATSFYSVFLSAFRSEDAAINHNATWYYIDDIVIADQYIGPMGTTLPAAPSNLRIVN